MEAQKELPTDTSQEVKRGRGRPRKEDRLMTRLQWEDQKKQVAGRPKGLRTAIKKVIKSIEAGDKAAAKAVYQESVGVIDAIADKKIIHKNKAARHKSRLAAAIKALAV